MCDYRLQHKTSLFFSMIQNFPKKSTMIISQGCFENFRKFSIYFFQFGPGKDEKIGFKVVNSNSEVIVIMD